MIIYYLGILMFYFLVINIVKSVLILRVALIRLLVSATLVGVFSLAQRYILSLTYEIRGDVPFEKVGVWWDPSKQETIGRAIERTGGTSGSPHIYSASLLVAIPLYIYFLQVSSSLRLKLVLGGASILAVSNLFLTHMRISVITLVIATALMLYKGLISKGHPSSFPNERSSAGTLRYHYL
jgi:hypothetical protein